MAVPRPPLRSIFWHHYCQALSDGVWLVCQRTKVRLAQQWWGRPEIQLCTYDAENAADQLTTATPLCTPPLFNVEYFSRFSRIFSSILSIGIDFRGSPCLLPAKSGALLYAPHYNISTTTMHADALATTKYITKKTTTTNHNSSSRS